MLKEDFQRQVKEKTQKAINDTQELKLYAQDKNNEIKKDDWSQVIHRKKRKFIVGNTVDPCGVKIVRRMVALRVTKLKPDTVFDKKKLPGVE